MGKVAIGRVVLTNREHIIALEPLDKGLMGTLLRYPYEVRGEEEYFDDIQDVKVTRDMLDLAKHIVPTRRAGASSPTSSRISTKALWSSSSTKSAPASRSCRRSDQGARTWWT
jgi:non-homologous end joining protein Ku